ncbi:NFX1-type zinc finger-containing protein 1 [Dissostichus eleginoides]|uniref:NFX1-type zinc finger-containing protein 1 n=1 Tax=Dissostichus eleginoides TaxID=100907 RepID=A0AAD9FFT2_DISEL|nr:NFX1-type zinc finger-containing protein 1 [Dissostichus eleginoides]
MEGPTLITETTGLNNDADAGPNESAHRVKNRRRHGRSLNHGSGTVREDTDEGGGGGGVGMRWRGRAADSGRGAADAGRGRGDAGRGRGDAGRRRGEAGRGRGDAGRGRGDAGRGRGEAGRGRGDAGRGRGDAGRGDAGRGRGATYASRGEKKDLGARPKVGGRGRGGDKREGPEVVRGVIGNGAAEREGPSGWESEVGVRREGHSVDGRRGERRDGARGRQEHNGGRSKSTGRVGVHHGLGYKTLEELSEKDPSVVAITLSSKPVLRELLGGTKMRNDLVGLLCLVLSKAFESRAERGTLQHLAGIIKESDFFSTVLPRYLVGMSSEFDPIRRAQYPRDLKNILAILSEVINTFPASSVNSVTLLLTLIPASVCSLRTSGVDIQPEIEERVKSIQGLIKHLQEKSREGTLRSDRDHYALLPTAGEEDQQDFRTISIYPTPEEFHQEERPFLRPNLTSQRYANTHLYLDTHFRLLREDFVRPLREGVQHLLRSKMEKGDKPLKTKRFDDIRIYFDTKLVVPQCTHNGIAYIVQFDIQPLKFVRWENSKRLIFGSLVCLSCDDFESFLLATVSDRHPKELAKGQVQIAFTAESRFKLAEMEKDQLFLMIETTAYFEAYRYVLEGLQEQNEDKLPFQRYIVECNKDVFPPAYLQLEDVYDLSDVALPQHKRSLKPFVSLNPQAWPQMTKLGLDDSQMKAFQLALTKELTIIQGPPGTGKTYVGLKIAQALLANRKLHSYISAKGIVRVGGRSNSEILKEFNLRELTRSPVFRHSLPSHLRFAYNEVYKELCQEERDIQSESMKLECSLKGVLREDFLQEFISDIHWDSLREQPTQDGFLIWGEKKKPSQMKEWLGLGSTVFLQRETENANGNEAADEEMELDDGDDFLYIQEEADLIQAERIVEDNIGPRGGRDGKKKDDMTEALRALEDLMLAINLEETEIQAEQSEAGWEMQPAQKKKLKHKIMRELGKSSAMTAEEEKAVLDIWTLSRPDRWRLYRLWMARYRGATVIGMTTTGAAKFRKVLQKVRPRLVIVEEAAEVLEAHTITTLSEACQHLILIGDHQQLRPSATVYELARNHNLEMSMFERLVKMGLPYVRLDYQHRMRPEIARLLTPHIYEELENHPSVFNYENIKGLSTNLFFVEHNYREQEIQDGKSHQNQHEASFVVALCRYLILQDYEPEKITILTTYTGQLHCLRNLMPAKEFAGVKVHVVDKYQGEENDIVLLSLVRSNLQGKVGFLNIPNRVCVALSRAKKGLYCIGNSEMLGKVQLWSNIFHTLRQRDQIGNALTLYCQNHPDRQVKASCADDFKQAPEGGCKKPCEFRLVCGHVCTRVCHPYDPEHKKYECHKKCQKTMCDLGHRCPLDCYKECPEECKVKVEKIIPRCQHTQMVPCHQDPETFVCQEPCNKLLDCEHPCVSFCGEPCTSYCKQEVTLTLKCGHSQQEIFFGTEDEPDAYFIQLEDCGHIVEYTAMDQYMEMDDKQQANEAEQVAIKLKECPRCRTSIRKNLRYGSHINRCLAEIEMVKVKINGRQVDIKEHKQALENQWEGNLLQYEMHGQVEYMAVQFKLQQPYHTAKDLWVLENKMDFLIRIAKLKKIQKENMSELNSETLGEYFVEFVRWLNNWRQKFSDQQVFDLQRELQRLTFLTELNARCHKADIRKQTDEINSEIQTIREVLERIGPFTEQDQDRVKEAMEELDSKLPPSGLGISEEERKMIVSAMKIAPGHWYKCPNGHVYVITECGGAVESRCCPDCAATIGGENHALAGGNQVASEMDGAQHPAWSEANNLFNFDQLDF